MEKLPTILASRGHWAAELTERLRDVDGITPQATPAGRTHTFQSYVVTVDPEIGRDDVQRRLGDLGIESTIGTYALHMEPTYHELGYCDDDLPCARMLRERSLTLPLFPSMTEADVDRIASAVAEAVAG